RSGMAGQSDVAEIFDVAGHDVLLDGCKVMVVRAENADAPARRSGGRSWRKVDADSLALLPRAVNCRHAGTSGTPVTICRPLIMHGSCRNPCKVGRKSSRPMTPHDPCRIFTAP